MGTNSNANQRARFLSLYCMVLADDIVDVRELETLYRIGIGHYDLSAEEINSMIVGAGTSMPELETTEEKIELLYQMAEIAWADNNIDVSETRLMKKYAKHMGFQEQNIPGIIKFLLEKAKLSVPFSEVLSEIMNS